MLHWFFASIFAMIWNHPLVYVTHHHFGSSLHLINIFFYIYEDSWIGVVHGLSLFVEMFNKMFNKMFIPNRAIIRNIILSLLGVSLLALIAYKLCFQVVVKHLYVIFSFSSQQHLLNKSIAFCCFAQISCYTKAYNIFNVKIGALRSLAKCVFRLTQNLFLLEI